MKAVHFLRASLAAGLALGGMSQAFALTAAGSSVANTASVAYKVGTVDQAPVNSNTSTFTVDRVIDITVTADNTPLNVVPDAAGNILSFTVTNQSNATLDFDVGMIQAADTTVMSGIGTDAFDMDNFTFFVDTNGNGSYDAGTDNTTTIDNLAAGDSAKVFAIAKTPLLASDGTYAGVEVTVIAKESTGAALSATVGANTAGMDTVFGDGSGPLSGDNARDATITTYGAYKVSTATLQITKSATVISDPVNGTTNPKAIPGAVVEYCLVVTNTGAAPADSIVLSDNLPAETTYDPTHLRVNVSGTSTTCTSGTGSAVTDATGDDTGDWVAGGTNGKGVVNVRTATIAATTGVFRATFRVTVD